MSVPAAYLGVILIWATTPLAIKWSGEGASHLFGLAGRMTIGLAACLLLVALFGRRMRWHAPALCTYLAAGVGMWAAMTAVYWAAQQMPSGLISVVYGLTPVVTGWMAAVWLREPVFSPFRVIGMLLGAVGLAIIFIRATALGPHAPSGIAAVVCSVVAHSLSSVWVKRIDARLHPLETTTGALIIALPLFLLTWWLSDGAWPHALPPRAIGAIIYLGLLGSVLGFVLYFYVLRHTPASRVALITLVTPVVALLIGQVLNGEQVGARVWLGTGVVLLGLASYQWGDRLRAQRLGVALAGRVGD